MHHEANKTWAELLIFFFYSKTCQYINFSVWRKTLPFQRAKVKARVEMVMGIQTAVFWEFFNFLSKPVISIFLR